MDILLDTCTFLWIIQSPEMMSKQAEQTYLNLENDIYLSSVSAWEIHQKHNLGKLQLNEPPAIMIRGEMEDKNILALDFNIESTSHLPKLPDIHKDPFDRMLICQAITHNMAILTNDGYITKYPIKTIW